MLRHPKLPYQLLIFCCAWFGLLNVGLAAGSVDKGDFEYSEPGPWPDQTLDLQPVAAQIAQAAQTHCASALAGEPMQLGALADLRASDSEQPATAGKLAGKLMGTLLGSPGGRKRPKLAKDPIKSKHKQKFDHPLAKARLQAGAVQQGDELILSARVAKGGGKNTFHTLFIERPDCVRIWPSRYEGYGLWGSWQLSVSITKTTSRYRNGELVNRSVDRSGWSKSGRFDPRGSFSVVSDGQGAQAGGLLLNSRAAFLQQLRQESGVPAWQSMGYAEPTSGIRSVGARFALQPQDLPKGSIAVVHLAQVHKGQYQTIGFPLRIDASATGALELSQLIP